MIDYILDQLYILDSASRFLCPFAIFLKTVFPKIATEYYAQNSVPNIESIKFLTII